MNGSGSSSSGAANERHPQPPDGSTAAAHASVHFLSPADSTTGTGGNGTAFAEYSAQHRISSDHGPGAGGEEGVDEFIVEVGVSPGFDRGPMWQQEQHQLHRRACWLVVPSLAATAVEPSAVLVLGLSVDSRERERQTQHPPPPFHSSLIFNTVEVLSLNSAPLCFISNIPHYQNTTGAREGMASDPSRSELGSGFSMLGSTLPSFELMQKMRKGLSPEELQAAFARRCEWVLVCWAHVWMCVTADG